MLSINKQAELKSIAEQELSILSDEQISHVSGGAITHNPTPITSTFPPELIASNVHGGKKK